MAHREDLPVLLPLVRLATGVAGAEPRHPGDLCRGQPIAAFKYGFTRFGRHARLDQLVPGRRTSGTRASMIERNASSWRRSTMLRTSGARLASVSARARTAASLPCSNVNAMTCFACKRLSPVRTCSGVPVSVPTPDSSLSAVAMDSTPNLGDHGYVYSTITMIIKGAGETEEPGHPPTTAHQKERSAFASRFREPMQSFGPWDTHSGPALRQELKPPAS